MNHRRLGSAGVRVSEVALGSWLTFGSSVDQKTTTRCVRRALELGVTFLDTADAYCLNDSDAGHNERLIARALETWNGDRSAVVVATKGGLTRPRGEWIPDGRGRHLRAACEASLNALGVSRIDLYQLHAPDPRGRCPRACVRWRR